MKKLVAWSEVAVLLLTILLSGVVYIHQWFSESQELEEYVASSPYRLFSDYSTDEAIETMEYEDMELFDNKNWWIGLPNLIDISKFRHSGLSIYSEDGTEIYLDTPYTSNESQNAFREKLKEGYVDYQSMTDSVDYDDSFVSHDTNWWFTVSHVPLPSKNEDTLVFLVYENVNAVALIRTLQYTFASLLLLQLVACFGFLLYRRYLKQKQMLDQQRQTFLHAISHEIKTPAAIIKNSVESLAEDVGDEHKEEYLTLISEEVDYVDGLLNAMLVYTETATERPLHLEVTSLRPMVENALSQYGPLLQSKGGKVEVSLDESERIPVARTLFPYVLDNLISNAVKHCEKDGTVRVSMEGDLLKVFNTGLPVSKEALPYLWEPLYIADSSRKEKSRSSGMGLAICANILDLHGAGYECRNVDDGVEFRIHFKPAGKERKNA